MEILSGREASAGAPVSTLQTLGERALVDEAAAGDTQRGLPNINEVSPFDERDLACIREMAEVAERHGLDGRYVVGLGHQHFDMRSDEALVETVNTTTRTLTARPVPLAELVLGKDEGVMVTDLPLTTEQIDPDHYAGKKVCIYVKIRSSGKHEHEEDTIDD